MPLYAMARKFHAFLARYHCQCSNGIDHVRERLHLGYYLEIEAITIVCCRYAVAVADSLVASGANNGFCVYGDCGCVNG